MNLKKSNQQEFIRDIVLLWSDEQIISSHICDLIQLLLNTFIIPNKTYLASDTFLIQIS